MSNPWFRLYSEIIEDEKLLMLAFQDRWHYVAILCLKNKGVLDQEANVQKLNRKVAAKLGVSLSEAEELKRRLAEEGLIDADSWQPNGWDTRQYKSDTSADRVRAHRERKKQECNVTGNVSVTPPDTDTDTERSQGSERELVSARASEPIGQGAPSRFPPRDFEPDADFHAHHRQLNPSADYERELRAFRNHEYPKPKTDWQRAWRKFWDDAKQFDSRETQPTGSKGEIPTNGRAQDAWSEVVGLVSNAKQAPERVTDPVINDVVQAACGGWGNLGRASTRDLKDYGFRFREAYQQAQASVSA